MPERNNQLFESLIQAMCPCELGSPDSQTDKDKQPAGARRDKHNQTGYETEAAYGNHKRLVEMLQHRVSVHPSFLFL